MKQSPAMPWMLTLLDDGLRLYRRHLPGFLLVSSAVLVPLALLDVLASSFVVTQLGDDWVALGIFLRLLLFYPALIYTAGTLSRATIMAQDGGPIRVLDAMRIGFGRTLGMGCYNILFSIISSIFFWILSLLVVCPVLYGSLFGVSFLGLLGGNSGTLGAAGGLLGVLFVIGFVFNMAMSGAQVVTMVYAIQPFVQEQRTFSNSLSRNVDLLTFRFGRNLLVFLGTGTIFAMLLTVYIGTLIGGGAALYDYFFGQPSPLIGNVLIVVLVTASAVLFFPPVAIWMALLHHRAAQERDAADLVTAVEQWRGTFSEGAAA